MRRLRTAALVLLLTLPAWTTAGAQSPIPAWTYVQGPDGQIWLVGDGARRVAVPVTRVSEADLATTAWDGQWIVPKPDGTGFTVGVVNAAGALVPIQTETAPSSTAPASSSGAVTIKGDGQQNTRPFDLGGGSYTVRWSGSQGNQGLGNLIITLRRADGQWMHETIVNTVLNKEKPTASGETQIYNVKSGPHYLEVLAPGAWSVEIRPQ